MVKTVTAAGFKKHPVTFLCECVYVCAHACTHVCIHACAHVFMHVCACM